MYSDAVKKKRPWLWLLLVLLVAALVIAATLIRDPARDLSEESAVAIQEAVRRSAMQCYAVEGVYPPDLAYLEENYGLQVNTEDFYVNYEAFASNLPPTIRVVKK